MRSILLAVHEDSLRQQLENLAMDLRPDCTILSTGDAHEARRLADTEMPSVVIADASLSIGGMLELVRRLQREQPALPIIMVCGLDWFEQVQRIVRPGSVDYLLRPFHAGDFSRLMQSIEIRIQAQRESGNVVPPVIEPGKADLEFAQAARLLPSLAAGSLNALEAGEFKRILPSRRGVAMVIAPHTSTASVQADADEMRLIAATLESYLGAPSTLLITPDGEKPLFLALAFLSGDQRPEWVRERLMAATAHLQYGNNIMLDIGVSLLSNDLCEYGQRAFEQAINALAYRFYYTGGCIVLCEDNQAALRQDLPYLQPLEKQLEQAVLRDEPEKAEEILARIFAQFDTWPRSLPHRVIRHLHHQMQRLVQLRAATLGEEGARQLTEENASLLGSSETLDALHAAAKIQLHRLISRQAIKPPLEDCIDYIQKHCVQTLKLEGIAVQFHMDPEVLSQAIIERTGMPFAEYLRAQRVEMADRLLKCTSLPLHEIALRVGYADPADFLKMYEQVTGHVPEVIEK